MKKEKCLCLEAGERKRWLNLNCPIHHPALKPEKIRLTKEMKELREEFRKLIERVDAMMVKEK